jgi:GT2 family glycosyltransferase
MIYKFKPFSSTKEIGKEYNAHCELVPNDDDWILIMDTDTMMLAPELIFPIIEKAIERYPDTTLFGAKTNRVGLSFLRHYSSRVDDDPNILNHYQHTIARAHTYMNGECEDIRYLAGFFMLFRKAYWKQNPFQETMFSPNGNLFDFNFCRPAMKAKQKIRVILGAYILHYYRMHKQYRDKSHLK